MMYCVRLARVNYLPMSNYDVLWHRTQTSKFDLTHPIYYFYFMVCEQTCVGNNMALSVSLSVSCRARCIHLAILYNISFWHAPRPHHY